MEDQLASVMRWLKSHLDRVVVGFVVIMFLVQVGLFMKERSQEPPPRPPLNPIRLQDEIDPEHATLVDTMYGEEGDPATDARIENLVKFNMFDVKTVKRKEDVDREIAEKLRSAEQLYNQNKKAEALAVVEEILLLDRNYLRAIDLRDKIQAELAPR